MHVCSVVICMFFVTITDNSSWLERLQSLPSILTFHQDVQLPPHYLMELCCLVGTLLGVFMMIFRAMRCSFMFLILWILYLSVYKVHVYALVSTVCICSYHRTGLEVVQCLVKLWSAVWRVHVQSLRACYPKRI